MSSHQSLARAEFRLYLSSCAIRLERVGADGHVETLARAAPESEAFGAALREAAAEAAGPVIAVLPAEAFRLLRVPDRPADRAAARATLARAFGVHPRDLALRTGVRDAAGETCLIALPRATLLETRDFLASHGIALGAVEPDADLPDFAAAPRFSPDRENDRLQGARLALTGVRPPAGPALAAGLAGLVALAALGLWAAVRGGPDEVGASLPPPPPVAVAVETEAQPVDLPPPPDVGLVLVQPPMPRPQNAPSLRLLTSAPPLKRQRPPAGLAAAGGAPEPAPAVTLASRSVAPDVRKAALAADRGAPPEGIVAATEADPEAERYARVAALGPMPRPGAADAAPEVARPAAADPGDALRPLRRPGDAPPASQPVEVAAPAPAAAGVRPLARPGGGPDRMLARAIETAIAEVAEAPPAAFAALATGTDASAGLAAAVATAVRPPPRRLAAPPVPRAPAAAVSRPAAAATAAPPPQQPVRVETPAPQRTARVQPAPQPQQTARAAPAAQPQQARSQPTAAAPAATQTGLARGRVSLVGVFGTQSQRHALLRMPSGSVKRVRAGETIEGVQVAAVGADSVRVRVNGSDTVLRMPD